MSSYQMVDSTVLASTSVTIMQQEIDIVKTTLVVIDPSVEDYQALIDGVIEGAKVFVLDANHDGVQQITDLLQDLNSKLKTQNSLTLHIVSHGTPGTLYLGNSELSLSNLNQYAEELSGWAVDELLLYGCNVAAGDAGEEFISKLSYLTRANIAASQHTIGGGYWSLDSYSGKLKAPAPFNSTVLATWSGQLAPTISNLSDSSYVEQDPAYTLDSDITFSGGTDYRGGYLEFSLNTATASDFLTLTTDGSPSTVNGQVSIVGDTVYLGNGTSAAVVGSVDSTFDGQNGQKLRINLSNGFTNGDFNLGSPGSTTITGWTAVNQQVKFGIDTIAGLPTPTDTTTPSPGNNSDQNNPSTAGSLTTQLDSTQNDGSGNSVRLRSSGIVAPGYSVIRGPYIYSNSTVSLLPGDQVSFEWQAQGGDDAYDVYGYIVDVNTGNIATILNETGNSPSASTTWATETITVSQAGDYRFVFVAGSYDFTGGTVLGAQLFIDDVTVTQANPPQTLNDSHISTLARRVQYSNTSDAPGTSRTLTVSVENSSGQAASDTAIITITPVDDPGSIVSGDTSGIGNEDTTITGTLVATDPDGLTDGTIFSIESGDGSTNGTASINAATGAWSYIPNANFYGNDTFTVTVTDDLGGLTTQVINITVSPVDDLSIISGDTSGLGDEDTSITGTLTASDVEGLNNGTIFSIESMDNPANGIASIDPVTGEWSYVPNANFNGSDSFTVTVTDDQGGVTTQVINITIRSVEDPATVSGDISGNGDENTTLLTGVLSASDPEGLTDGTIFSIEFGDEPINGTASINAATGEWAYTPNANYLGSDSFTVTITDDHGGTTTQVITLNIQDTTPPVVPSLPGLDPGSDQGSTGGSKLTNNSKPGLSGTGGEPGSTIELFIGDRKIGETTVDSEGNWTVTPPADLEDGTHKITARATDTSGNSSPLSGTLTITVDTKGALGAVISLDEPIRDFGVQGITIKFNEKVLNFDLADIQLTLDGKSVDLTGATLTSSDEITWLLGNIPGFAEASGNYQINLSAGDITDYAGNGLSETTGTEWLTGYTADPQKKPKTGGRTKFRGRGTNGDDGMPGTNDRDVLSGRPGDDKIRGRGGNDKIVGGGGKDKANGGSGNDLIGGRNGNDTLLGGSGNDKLVGGSGNDNLRGGSGDDLLFGKKGRDTMIGGRGSDTFLFRKLVAEGDAIRKFDAEEDFIDVRGIFNRPAFNASNRFAQFIEHVELVQVGSSTEVHIDADGNGSGTDMVKLVTLLNTNVTSISSENFVIGNV